MAELTGDGRFYSEAPCTGALEHGSCPLRVQARCFFIVEYLGPTYRWAQAPHCFACSLRVEDETIATLTGCCFGLAKRTSAMNVFARIRPFQVPQSSFALRYSPTGRLKNMSTLHTVAGAWRQALDKNDLKPYVTFAKLLIVQGANYHPPHDEGRNHFGVAGVAKL